MDFSDSSTVRRPTWAEVDLRALTLNLGFIQGHIGAGRRTIAVIKANAYGHGAVELARRLEELGVSYLAVAILEEALELRAAGIKLPILLLNGFWPGQEELIVHHGLTPAVDEAEKVRALNRVAERMKRKACYHLKINTGMSRLGADWEQAKPLIESALQHQWAHCQGIFTHLSSSDDMASSETVRQLERFNCVLKDLQTRGFSPEWTHAANSAAVLRWPGSWYDAVRPGLILYGVNPFEKEPTQLRPLLALKTQLMHLRPIKKGTSVGYGCSYTASRNSVIAALPIGYADGYNRLLSNRGSVLVCGQRVPIIGRISMDLTLVDVTDLLTAKPGAEVVLIGKQGSEQIGVGELAELCHTIPYEILTGISQRVPRVFLNPQ